MEHPTGVRSKLEEVKHGAQHSVNSGEGRHRLSNRRPREPVEKMPPFKYQSKRKFSELQQAEGYKRKENRSPEYSNGRNPLKDPKATYSYSQNEISRPEKRLREDNDSNSRSKDACESQLKGQFEITKDELSRIRLSRKKFEKLVHTPFFEKTVVGSFVKVGLGFDCGNQVYIISEIQNVEETAEVYELGNTKTNVGLILKHGLESRVIRLEFISNQDFSDTEFSKWRDTVSAQGYSLPTAADVNRKAAEIEEALNRDYSEADVEFILKQKERFITKPRNFARQKILLACEKEETEQKGKVSPKLNQDISKLKATLEKLHKQQVMMTNRPENYMKYTNTRHHVRENCEAPRILDIEENNTKCAAEYDPFTRRRCAPVLFTRKRKSAVSSE